MTQQKQALLMWRLIANNIKHNRMNVLIEDFKRQFCRQRNIKWRCNCFICEHTDCAHCRLHTCGTVDSAYKIASSDSRTIEQRLRACFSIIEAIRRIEGMYYISVEGEEFGDTAAEAEANLVKNVKMVYKIDGITVSKKEWERSKQDEVRE